MILKNLVKFFKYQDGKNSERVIQLIDQIMNDVVK